MSILFNALVIFIFVFLALYLDFPVIQKDDALMNKAYLFVGVFALQVILLSVNKIKSKCETTTHDIMKEAMKTALFAVVAYSVYTDTLVYPKYASVVGKYALDPRLGPLFSSGMIAALVGAMQVVDNALFPKTC
jgi:RsiW-degrading membrane proteinase PrsW (M82 family)